MAIKEVKIDNDVYKKKSKNKLKYSEQKVNGYIDFDIYSIFIEICDLLFRDTN